MPQIWKARRRPFARIAFAERVLPRAADLWVQASFDQAAAVTTTVLYGGNFVRRKRLCSNGRNRSLEMKVWWT